MNYNYPNQQNYYEEEQYSCPWVRGPQYYAGGDQFRMIPYQENRAILSARNQFKGTVVKLKVGDVVGQVLVDIGCGNSMSSIITTDSIKELGIKIGSKVKTVVKSSDVVVMIAASDNNNISSNEMKLSARNQFKGTAVQINLGDVNSQVLIDIGCGNMVSSVITTASVRELGINIGSKVIAVIKSTVVMIMA